MKRLVVAVAAAAAALLAGCSGNAPPATQTVRTPTSIMSTGQDGTVQRSIDTYHVVGGMAHRANAAPDRVWEALPAVYQGLGIAVGTSIPDSKTIGNTKLELSRTLAGQPLSSFLNCGEGATGTPHADTYRVTLSVLTLLTPAENGGTRVETRVNASAANRSIGSIVSCSTTGRLEGMIAERIKTQTNS